MSVCPHTLLLLHVGEVFEREGPHGRSPESIRLHDGLQPGSDRDSERDKVFQSRLEKNKKQGESVRVDQMTQTSRHEGGGSLQREVGGGF